MDFYSKLSNDIANISFPKLNKFDQKINELLLNEFRINLVSTTNTPSFPQ